MYNINLHIFSSLRDHNSYSILFKLEKCTKKSNKRNLQENNHKNFSQFFSYVQVDNFSLKSYFTFMRSPDMEQTHELYAAILREDKINENATHFGEYYAFCFVDV